MPFTQLPPEILLQIASWVDRQSSLASFAQVNRKAYQTLIMQLYLRNALRKSTRFQESAISLAVKSGNCSTLKKALDAWRTTWGPAELPNLPGWGQIPPLFLAAFKGLPEAARMLLDYGVDPNLAGRENETPLFVASTLGKQAIVEMLLAHPKINVNGCDTPNASPICGAAANGHAEIVKMLLLSGANLTPPQKGKDAPLHCAVLRKRADLVRHIINRKDIDPNLIGKTGTPLQLAVDANDEELVELLLTDKRVNPDLTLRSSSQTPLLEAALKNNGAIVGLLLKAGANKAIQDRTFLSAAMVIDAPNAEARCRLINDHNATLIQMGMSS